MNKLFFFACTLVLSVHATSTMKLKITQMQEIMANDIESQEPVTLAQLQQAVKDNNTNQAIQLLQTIQLQKNAQDITEKFKTWISKFENIPGLENKNNSCKALLIISISPTIIGCVTLIFASIFKNYKGMICGAGIISVFLPCSIAVISKYMCLNKMLQLAKNSSRTIQQIVREFRETKVVRTYN